MNKPQMAGDRCFLALPANNPRIRRITAQADPATEAALRHRINAKTAGADPETGESLQDQSGMSSTGYIPEKPSRCDRWRANRHESGAVRWVTCDDRKVCKGCRENWLTRAAVGLGAAFNGELDAAREVWLSDPIPEDDWSSLADHFRYLAEDSDDHLWLSIPAIDDAGKPTRMVVSTIAPASVRWAEQGGRMDADEALDLAAEQLRRLSFGDNHDRQLRAGGPARKAFSDARNHSKPGPVEDEKDPVVATTKPGGIDAERMRSAARDLGGDLAPVGIPQEWSIADAFAAGHQHWKLVRLDDEALARLDWRCGFMPPEVAAARLREGKRNRAARRELRDEQNRLWHLRRAA